MANKEWHVIGRGFNGWHAKGVNVSSSGGDIVPRTFWTGERMATYTEQAVEGALVYDAKACEESEEGRAAFIKLVFSGPMVNPELPPNGVEHFSDADRKAALRMLPGLSGGYDTLAMLAQSEAFTGLDYIGVGVFEALLRSVPGVRIGHVKNGAIAWE
jgi:hypothetical protein